MVLSSHGQPVGLTAGRQRGRPADKIRVRFKIFKILYRLNYSGFLSIIITMLLQYRTTFQLAFAKQSFFKCLFFKCEKIGSHFFMSVNPQHISSGLWFQSWWWRDIFFPFFGPLVVSLRLGYLKAVSTSCWQTVSTSEVSNSYVFSS